MQNNQQEPGQGSNQPAIFQDNSALIMAQNDAAAVARATQEVQASLVIAQRFPRDEIKAKARILQACQRKGLAEVAEYEYSRGGSRITGPTVDLLRAIASRWGHMRWGWAEIERRNAQSMVRCWAWDLQTGSQAERTFVVEHWRDTQAGGYELTDERDIYELLANFAARRVRGCMEEVIDSDIVQDAVDECRKTLRVGEKESPKDIAVKLVNAFTEFGVTKEMIEARITCNLEAISMNQIATLRRIFKSLKDGVGKREDYFKAPMHKPEFEGAGTDPGKEGPVSESPGQASTQPVTADSGKAQGKVAPAAANPAPSSTKDLLIKSNDLEKLRKLCKDSGVKEGQLLGFLTDNGSTDGSVSTLEELVLNFANVAKLVVEQWADVSGRILGDA